MDIDNTEQWDDNTTSKSVNDFPGYDDKYKLLMSSAGNEIVVDLTINVLSKNPNDEAAIPTNNHVYNNNYWIPVPSGHNVDEYVLAFIKHFEQALSSSIE